MPVWRHYGISDSAAKLEREVKSFHNKLKRYGLGECLISLNEHSTKLLSSKDHIPITDQAGETDRHRRDPYTLKHLNLSVTTSPYASFNSEELQDYLHKGQENYWLSLPSKLDGSMAPILTRWKGQFSVRLNITNNGAATWYLNNVKSLINKLGTKYIKFEGVEGNTFLEQSIQPPRG
ncbi:unnamed protein product, partial [Staurois parvus]